MLEDKIDIQEFADKFCAEKREASRFQTGDIKCGVSSAGGFYIEAKKNIYI